MTPADRLAAIRARVEAATPGPWEVHKSDVIRVLPDPTTGEPEPHLVAQSWPVDASFIAHARTDIPALLAAVEAALAACDVETVDAQLGEEYAAKVNDGTALIAQGERRYAAEAIRRAITEALT